MAQKVREVESTRDKYNQKEITHVRTDAERTYVFERFEGEGMPARLARRGKGPDGRRECTTRRARLPRQVERVADAEFGSEGWQK